MRRSAAMLLAAAVTALAATGGATSSTARSGLYGSVRLNPAIPVCTVATPCSKPLPDFPLVFSREGRRVARVRTDGRGHYRVALPVGVYTVATTRPRGIGRGLEPTRVRVAAARYRRVDFDYDSGIR